MSPDENRSEPAELIAPGRYLGLVASLPCAICRRSPVEVHHKRAGTGLGRKASDFDTMPLCWDHHHGPAGIHGMGSKAFAKHYGTTEQDLADEAGRRLGFTPEDRQRFREAEEAREQDRRDRRRKVSQRPRAAPMARAEAPRKSWPRRKLESANRLRSRPFRSD